MYGTNNTSCTSTRTDSFILTVGLGIRPAGTPISQVPPRRDGDLGIRLAPAAGAGETPTALSVPTPGS